METRIDLSRWREAPRGLGYRRWTILSTGVRQLLRTRFFKLLLVVGWGAALIMILAAFLISQSVAAGGWLELVAGKLGPRAEAFASALGAFVLLYPDICVDLAFTQIFWLHSFVGLSLSMFALAALVPHLITRDRASHALTIYLSRPLTSVDYLLGKLGTIVGVLMLLWTGPLLCGWLFSMALAPSRDFLIYSLQPLARALTFHTIALVSVAAVALGVSAVVRSSRSAVALWLGLWLVFAFAAQPPGAPGWLKRASLTENLHEVRQEIFNLEDKLDRAATALPLIGPKFGEDLRRAAERAAAPDTASAGGALVGFVMIASFVFFRRLRPE